MAKITETTYTCDNGECGKRESDLSNVFNWLAVGSVRAEIVPARNYVEHKRYFCSRECLAQWASAPQPHPVGVPPAWLPPEKRWV